MIRVKDEIGLASVQVVIAQMDGTAIETGLAVETRPRSARWIYTATAPVAAGSEISIEVTATDYTGKKVSMNEYPIVGAGN